MTRTNGRQVDTKELALRHFATLDRHNQEAAIRRMAAAGHGDHTIAAATGYSVVLIRRVLAELQGNGPTRGTP